MLLQGLVRVCYGLDYSILNSVLGRLLDGTLPVRFGLRHTHRERQASKPSCLPSLSVVSPHDHWLLCAGSGLAGYLGMVTLP